MNLYEIFSLDRIKLHLQSSHKDEVFEELTNFLVEKISFLNSEEILTALRTREQKMTTGLKNGIAVPHGRTSLIEGITGVLGISDQGIDYDALDKKSVHYVFLFLSDPSTQQEHLSLLSQIGRLAEDKHLLYQFSTAETPEKIYSLLKSSIL